MPQPLSRRDFLVRASLLTLGGPAFLAACSKSKDSASGGGGSGDKSVRIANWPLYIEDDQNPQNAPTIANFTKKTGIAVDYKTAVDANDSFTSKYEGDLAKGNDIGFDIVVLTSWMCANWIKNGWAQEIPADKVPNKSNLLDRLANPGWDPGRVFTMPYAIGQVGIAYYPDKVGRDLTSINDLFDPALKGKVTILSEMRDTIGSIMLADGMNPEDATVEGALKAIERVKVARDSGQFRKITGNSYIEDLGLGDVHAALAWSGDVASLQQDNPDIKWVLPADGAMSFVDTLMIPKSGNVETASEWINWLYDPTVSGPLFEAISYSSPVKGAGDSMSAAAASNPLINPAADANIHEFRALTAEEAEELETAFAAATQQ